MTQTMDHPLWAQGKLRLILTSECNINCCYCHNEGQLKGSTYLGTQLFELILELARCHLPNSVTLTGGEPLLHPEVISFVRSLRQYCDNVTMVSNGLLLSDAKIAALIAAGLTKFRIGADSLASMKSRPATGVFPSIPITEIIENIRRHDVRVELNLVLTKFNQGEVSDIVRWCSDRRISIKAFEHVKVMAYGSLVAHAQMEQQSIVPFEEFRSAVLSTGLIQSEYVPEEYVGSNHLFRGEGFSVRYCRYLCPFGLCRMTGTRIDPNGTVYACMEKRGARNINPEQPIDQIRRTIREAVSGGCRGGKG